LACAFVIPRSNATGIPIIFIIIIFIIFEECRQHRLSGSLLQ